MRYAALPGMLVLFIGSAANAQLSIQPQVGLEQSNTSFSFNNSTYSSLPNQLEPKGAVRFDYKFKKGHGPYVSIGSSPGVSSIHFSGFDNAVNQHATTVGSMQWRLEGGYQYTSKPINFKRGQNQKPVVATKTTTTNVVQKRCGSYYYKSSESSAKAAAPKVNESWNMRIQPSAGVAYIPSAKENLTVVETMNQTNYEYRAGNYKTGFVSGVGLLFGKGTRDLFSLNVYYLKVLSNLGNQTLTRITEGKSTTAQIRSVTSSWSLSLGLPLQLQKQKVVKKVAPTPTPVEKRESYKSRCGQYSRCSKGYN